VTKAQLLLDCELRSSSIETNAALEAPISLSEIRNAIAKGKSHKAPGNDGIGLEFYKAEWKTIKTDLLQILNSMYIDGTILMNQLKGIIVCITKHAHPVTIDDYRPLTLMNTDNKILTKIIAA